MLGRLSYPISKPDNMNDGKLFGPGRGSKKDLLGPDSKAF